MVIVVAAASVRDAFGIRFNKRNRRQRKNSIILNVFAVFTDYVVSCVPVLLFTAGTNNCNCCDTNR